MLLTIARTAASCDCFSDEGAMGPAWQAPALQQMEAKGWTGHAYQTVHTVDGGAGRCPPMPEPSSNGANGRAARTITKTAKGK
jgi:hypothetical protein